MATNASILAAFERMWQHVISKIGEKADLGHTHNYAGSSSAGGAATSANKINTNAGSTTQPVYFANGIPVKTTYTLGKSVPSDAKFTDTTYSNATTSAAGLMSGTDKTKLDATNIAYGTCSTAAATAAKVVTLSDNTNWTLKAGSMVTVFFSETNSAQNPTLNVNSTGAKNIFFGASQITTSSLGYAGTASRIINFMYDGIQYRFMGWGYDSNTQSNTNSTDTSSKIFLVGATSQGSNKTTYSHGEVYVGTDHHVYSNSKQAVNLSDTQALTNKTYEGYTLGDACAKDVDTIVTNDSANLITSDAVYNRLGVSIPYAAESTDGKNYTVTIPNLTELTAGMTINIIPNMTATSDLMVKINVNDLGLKPLRRRTTGGTVGLKNMTSVFRANTAVKITLIGSNWALDDFILPDVDEVIGTVSVEYGGTGATTAADARTNFDVYSKSEVDSAISTAIGSAIAASY